MSFFFSVFLLLLSLSSLCVCIFLLVSLAFFLHLLVYSSLVCLGFRFIFHLCSVVSIAPGCLSPSPSLFGVSVWRFHRGVVFVGVSSFLTGSVASALPVFHSIYVRWSSTLLSSLSIFRPPLCHFVCPFSRFSSSGHSDHCLLQPPLSSLLSVHNRLHFLSSTALSGWSLIDRLFWPPFWPRSVPWTLVAIGYLAIPLRSLLYYMSPSDFIVIFIFVGSVRLFLFSSVSVRLFQPLSTGSGSGSVAALASSGRRRSYGRFLSLSDPLATICSNRYPVAPVVVRPFRPLFGGSLSSPSGHSDHCSAILDAAVAPRPLFGRRGHLRPLLSSLSGNLHSDAVRPLRPLLGRSSVSVGVWSSVYFSISVALLVLMSTTLRSRTFCSFVRPIPVSLCLSPSLCDWPPLFGRISHRDCLFFVIVSVVARSGAIQPLQLLFGRSPVGAFPASPPSLSILVLSTALPLLSGDTGFPIVPVRCLCAFCPAMLPHGRHC